MSGFAFSSRTMSLKKSLIIALSHSGQTFPTLHATHALRKLCGDRVFVLTGSIDSKMSAAVGQLRYRTSGTASRIEQFVCHG
jgi:fructoselysine-6-P-deglycase FrlB-like protein